MQEYVTKRHMKKKTVICHKRNNVFVVLKRELFSQRCLVMQTRALGPRSVSRALKKHDLDMTYFLQRAEQKHCDTFRTELQHKTSSISFLARIQLFLAFIWKNSQLKKEWIKQFPFNHFQAVEMTSSICSVSTYDSQVQYANLCKSTQVLVSGSDFSCSMCFG